MPSQTFTSNTTYAIPSDAANVTYIIHGGKGAVGGPCNSRVNRSSGGAGARGQKISGTLTGVAGSTLTLTMGGNGSGVGGNRDTGGNGGGGYWNGGRGGNNNSQDSDTGWNAGGGGGGGGATAIRIGNTVLAGAGGGGGGGCICNSGATDGPGLTSSDINTSGGSNGAAGQNSGSGGAWNGGGGGAGGGFPGGTSGSFGPGYAWNGGNDSSGYGGAGGAGLYNPSYHRSASTLETSSSDSAFITISYEDQIVTSDSNWTTRSPQLDNFVGAQGSDPYNAWTTFLTNTNVGGQEPEGTTVNRSIEWKININNEGRQIFNTAVDDDADVYIDNVFQFSLNTYNANTSLTTADIISAGEHTIRIEHVNTGGPYGVAMDWTGYIPPVPPTVSLTTSDNYPVVGQSLTLTYSGSGFGITGYSFTQTVGGVTSPAIPGTIGGSGVYFPAASTTRTYTYSATNPYGTSTDSELITVIQFPVVSLISSDSNNTIIKGQSVVLTWSATSSNPSGYNITNTSMTGVSSPGFTGSTLVTPNVTTAYTYSATNYAGTRSDTETITVQIIPPVVSLTSNASSDTITRPGSVTLTWSASATGNDITSTSLVDNNGNVVVSNPGTSGNVLVSPAYNTTYTFSATNPSGTTNAVRPITVILPPPVVTLDIVDSTGNVITDNTIIEGESLFLRWNADGFDITSTTLTNYSSPGLSGTASFSPTVQTTYTYSATNASGTDTDSVTIIVYYKPVLALTTNVEDSNGESTIDLFDSVDIIWSTTGDGGTVTWTSGTPAIINSNGNGTQALVPLPYTTLTETYCAFPSGLGGIGDTECVTINVIPPPPIVSTFSAFPNPPIGLDGTPLYQTTLYFTSTGYGTVTGKIFRDGVLYNSSVGSSGNGTLVISDLPQSIAGSSNPISTEFGFQVCNEGGCSPISNITIFPQNDNTLSNNWTSSFINLDPNTQVVVTLGILDGVDMPTTISVSGSGNFMGRNGAFTGSINYNNGDVVQLKTTTMPFNTTVPASGTFGLTNSKVVTVSYPTGSINVIFTTKAPVVAEIFDYTNTTNKYPYEDIDLITNSPTEYLTSSPIGTDDIEIPVEVKSSDENTEVSINGGPWQDVRSI
jgi:hypothetical protein